MHNRTLRELAKVGTGLFLADLISVVWLGNAGFFPLTVLGVTWTAQAIIPIVLFDAATIIILAHIGWNIKIPVESPSEKHLLTTASAIFLVVALVHLMRIALGWSFILGDFVVPMWLSWFGVLVAAYLSYASFHFAHRAGRH